MTGRRPQHLGKIQTALLGSIAPVLTVLDREAIVHVATTEGIKSEDVQDLVITAVENRFGRTNPFPSPLCG